MMKRIVTGVGLEEKGEEKGIEWQNWEKRRSAKK